MADAELQILKDAPTWTGNILAISSPHTLPDTVGPVFVFEMSIQGQKNAVLSIELDDIRSTSIVQIVTAAFVSRAVIEVGRKINANSHTVGWARIPGEHV